MKPSSKTRSKPLHPVECEKRTEHATRRILAQRTLTLSEYPFMDYVWYVCPTCGLQWIKIKVMHETGTKTLTIDYAIVNETILEDVGRHANWMSGNRREEDEKGDG